MSLQNTSRFLDENFCLICPLSRRTSSDTIVCSRLLDKSSNKILMILKQRFKAVTCQQLQSQDWAIRKIYKARHRPPKSTIQTRKHLKTQDSLSIYFVGYYSSSISLDSILAATSASTLCDFLHDHVSQHSTYRTIAGSPVHLQYSQPYTSG